MAHFAKIENELVVLVIVAEQAFIDSLPDSQKYVQTSYNTHQGKHAHGGVPLRKNYAGIGYTYSKALDAFIPPRPDSNHDLNIETGCWVKKRTRNREGTPVPGPYVYEVRDNNGKRMYEIIEEGPSKWERRKVPLVIRGLALDTRK